MADDFASLFAPPDKQAALLAALRRQRAAGNLGMLTGDRVLGDFGASQVRQADAGEAMQLRDAQAEEFARLNDARTRAYAESVAAAAAASSERGKRDAERLELEQEREARRSDEAKRKAAALPGALARKAEAVKAKADEKAKAGAFRDSSVLRKEFNALPDVRQFGEASSAFRTIETAAASPSAAGDLSLIFAYMKVLDPASSVREGEFANAQNAAGVDDRVRNQWNKLLRGERLNPAQRADFVAQAKNIYAARKKGYDAQAQRYRSLAEKSNISPDDVTGPMEAAAPTAQPSGRVVVSNGKETLEIDAVDLPDARADGFEVVR